MDTSTQDTREVAIAVPETSTATLAEIDDRDIGTSSPATPNPTSTVQIASLATTLPVTLSATPELRELPASLAPNFPEFFFANDPDCHMPCWHGLLIGQSDSNDLQRFLTDELGQTDLSGFFPSEVPESQLSNGIYTARFWWETDNDQSFYYVNLRAFVEANTNIVRGISIEVAGQVNDVQVDILPQRVLQTLGPPTHTLAWVQPTNSTDSFVLRFVLVYADGWVFAYQGIVAPSDEDGNRKEITYCLDQHLGWRNFDIVEPFDVDLDPQSLSTVQSAVLYPSDLLPSEQVMGFTSQEITEIALDTDDPCIEFEYLGMSHN